MEQEGVTLHGLYSVATGMGRSGVSFLKCLLTYKYFFVLVFIFSLVTLLLGR